MAKIKVLFDGISCDLGGVGSVILNIIDVIDKEKYQPHVLFTGDSVYEAMMQERGVFCHKIATFGKHPLKYKKQLQKLLMEQKFQFVWVHNTSKINMWIFKLAKKYGATTLSHSHGERSEASGVKGIIFGIIERLNAKKFYKLVDVPVACSVGSANYFYDRTRLKDKKVNILHNAVNTQKFAFSQPLRDDYRAKYGMDKDNIVLGHIGRLCHVKNQKFIIDVMTKLDNRYKALLVGDGADYDQLVEYIRQLGVADRVILAGKQSDIQGMLSTMDMFLLPSMHEGMPLVIIEGQASGLPMIIADTVSSDGDILPSTIHLPLDANQWVDKITNCESNDRQKAIEAVANSVYDLSNLANSVAQVLSMDKE